MKISSIQIKNFRKLQDSRIDFSNSTTLFVGANNSGKTSAMDAMGKFLAGRSFSFNDFTISNRKFINACGENWIKPEAEKPTDIKTWENFLPSIDVWITVELSEIHYVLDLIPTLEWKGGLLGVRLIFQPKDIGDLFINYREAYETARRTEDAGKKIKKPSINLYPKKLSDFVERKLLTYFGIKSYILDSDLFSINKCQPTPFERLCSKDNILKDIIRIDMIDAQRGFSDPDSKNQNEITSNQLSAKMRNYYDMHLDIEKQPSPEDIEIISATEKAKEVFEKGLTDKFSSAIKELEMLGYPGITDPKITLSAKVNTGETLKHDSAVQYALSKKERDLKLPEKYNGLGYQNLISIVFDLISFRDGWMRVGKAKSDSGTSDIIEPLHLVLIEEPEAHLHVQVQQVFIKKAYEVLCNCRFLNENKDFMTQLIISTHSSYIAREVNFANLRYFKRLPEDESCSVATVKVVNLSDVFGEEDKTDKFTIRYLQSTHCDLFFADAAILVEGAAENMLVPHFIKNKFPELDQRYISILSINGRHSHRLSPLLEKLSLPCLIITDIDACEEGGHHKSIPAAREANFISSNYAITAWLIKEKKLDLLYNLEFEKKVFKYNSEFDGSIRIAYQTPIKVSYKEEEKEALPTTFEDSIIYTNYDLFANFNISAENGSLVNKVVAEIKDSKDYKSLCESIYNALHKGQSNQKAEFALDLIFAFDPAEIAVPRYINEGLEWLQLILHQGDND